MSGRLIVESPGLMTTLQDRGRIGHQRLGIPVAGAIDAEALAAANIVAGNAPGAGALECLYQGPTLRVDAESVRVAVAGAGSSLLVRHEDSREDVVPALQSVRLKRGDRVRVVLGAAARCACFAVAGGFAVRLLMGSVATYVRGGLGGFAGRRLQQDDELPLVEASAPEAEERVLEGVTFARPDVVRVVLGPQDDYFAPEALSVFLSERYAVTASSDRMGLRLDGPRLKHTRGYNIVSDAIAYGAIQVPGDGLPIILLADRQTTGGYPKIATVITADLPSLGRLAPGDAVRFEAISVTEAETLARDTMEAIGAWPQKLKDARNHKLLLTEDLLNCNLISGVIDAGGDGPHTY